MVKELVAGTRWGVVMRFGVSACVREKLRGGSERGGKRLYRLVGKLVALRGNVDFAEVVDYVQHFCVDIRLDATRSCKRVIAMFVMR